MIELALVIQILHKMNLTNLEKRNVTKCLFGNQVARQVTVDKLQTCVTKEVAYKDHWYVTKKGCIHNDTKVQPMYYLPGVDGIEGGCVD